MLPIKGPAKVLSILVGLMALAMIAGACGEDATPTPAKELIRFHDGQWETLWLNNAIAMYITEKGYGYPVEQIEGTTGTMKVALPEGDLHVNMELWRANIRAWYDENIANGKLVDLAGTGNNVGNGSKGQILETSMQGWYVPTYIIEQNPGLKSVMDLPKFKELFKDPEDSSKGVWINCILGWQCQKVFRAKAHAYGLSEHYNIMEPATAAGIEAAIKGAYEAGEPVLSYYWEPTKLLSDLDMTILEEPERTQACEDALTAAVESEPYESTEGCADPQVDVHTGVHSSLVARAPEVTEFLGKMFIGALTLDGLTAWRTAEGKEPEDAAIYWLKNNEATYTTWMTAEAAKNVKEALAK
jgi:glycine betaine/proline transport system substrate-binding protein